MSRMLCPNRVRGERRVNRNEENKDALEAKGWTLIGMLLLAVPGR